MYSQVIEPEKSSVIFFSIFVSPSKISKSLGNTIFGLPILERFPSPFKVTLNTTGDPSSIFEFESDELRVKSPTGPVKFSGIFCRGNTLIETGSETSSLALVL